MNNFEKNLDILSNIIQLRSYDILVHDFNNYDLMRYLRHQDDLLNEIIKQNEKIIKLLEGR